MSRAKTVVFEYVTEEDTIGTGCDGGERKGEHRRERSLPQWLTIASCAAAIGTLVPVALYQTALIDHLPDPPGRLFQSDYVSLEPGSHPLGIPDSYLGLASYGATLALLLSQKRSPLMNVARHAKLAMDGAMAGTKAVGQIRKGRYCSWCLGTAAATGAMLLFGYLTGKKQREERAA